MKSTCTIDSGTSLGLEDRYPLGRGYEGERSDVVVDVVVVVDDGGDGIGCSEDADEEVVEVIAGA